MVIKNYIYNLIYQLLTVILPIITIPYISRILGADGLGVYALTSTYAQYFVLFGMLGLTTYSSREIACNRESNESLSCTFWELNFLRFITMGISGMLYIIIFIFIIKGNNKVLNIIQGLLLINSFLDISWLFVGLENFKKVVIRNTIVKLSGVILIFALVKNSSQVWLYALILGGTQVIGQLIMWLEIPKNIKFIIPKKVNLIKHLNSSIKLFIPQIAITVYTMLDKVMLGFFSDDSQVGMYDNSQKIIKILVIFVTVLSTVTIPKMANLYKNNHHEEFRRNVYKSFSFVSFISFPMCFGLISITNSFVPWFYGDGFSDIKILFYIGSFLMITLGWTSILGNQVLISIRRENKFTIAVFSGAIINFILNCILINKLYSAGTMIASVVAEYLGMILMLYYLRDILEIPKMFKSVPKYLIASLIMFIPTFIVGINLRPTIITTIIQVILGSLIYFIIMIIIKDENLNYVINFIKDIKNKKRD